MPSNALTPSVARLSAPWENNENYTWLGSTITFQRNFDKFKFPGKMPGDRRQQVLNMVSNELIHNHDLTEPTLLKGEEVTPLDKEYLMEHFLSIQNFQQAHAGEGFIIDKSSHFFSTINLSNHLQLTLLDTEGELEKTWEKLVKIESKLGTSLKYAFSPKFGYLTADPHQCGTALTVTAFLQLPALAQTGELEAAIKKTCDEQILVTGIQGSPTDWIGNIIALQNNYMLGVTEEHILSVMRSAIIKLQVLENSAKLRLKEQEKPEIKDHVSRAFAILLHSYQIEAIEALNAISLLKLGVELNWVKGISVNQLNSLFFTCRRAHLLGKSDGIVNNDEIPHKRAEHIHTVLKNVELVI